MAKITFSPEEFQQAAATFRKDLLRLPIISAQATLKYMTVRPGILYEESVGSADVDIELAPYKPNRRTNVDLDLGVRTLATYFGSVNGDFEPNKYIQTILGHKASQAMGGSLANTVSAREVLGLMGKKIGKKLNMALWCAVRNPNGHTTKDLFDGWDTITKKEIAAGAIAEDKGNYIEIKEEITDVNAVDIAQSIMYAMSEELREEHCYMYCTRNFYDKYCKAYQLTHGGVPYNTQYKQTCVEGSDGMLELRPLASKKGSEFIHVSPKENMLFGCDQMSDMESVNVEKFAPDTLTYESRMFAGCQFESIDNRRLMVAKIA